ncbi:hypothetical protein U6A24_04145 [Aquimarina gracilis]|uniref:Natural product n=1 Tax=Aquimarina gracilis TaxID=874422 RepID=A0ABU5ZRH2_9FLAO|nr:hypothetical protein [Aquimarina gracilis]MEB3344637.1 hypothetical protein [Aquimarina gracilis]
MKKKNLKKLSFDKNVISNLNLKKVTGGQLSIQSIQGAAPTCTSSANGQCNLAC